MTSADRPYLYMQEDLATEDGIDAWRLGNTEAFILTDSEELLIEPCFICQNCEIPMVSIQVSLDDEERFSRVNFCLNHVERVQSLLNKPANNRWFETLVVDVCREEKQQYCPVCSDSVNSGQNCIRIGCKPSVVPIVHRECATGLEDALDSIWEHADDLLGAEL